MGHATVCKLTKLKVSAGRDIAHRRSLTDRNKVETDELSLPSMKQRPLVTFALQVVRFEC